MKGVITEVYGAAEGAVQGFRIEADGGERYAFTIDPSVHYGFDLRHLEEHQRTRQPVVVESVVGDAKTYATSVLDA